MIGQAAFAAGETRLFARPLVRHAFGVRRLAALAGNLTASVSIQQCESS